MNAEFYESNRWRAARRSVLSACGYRCRNCIRYGKHTDATVVHHANPLEEYPELGFTFWNLVALCDKCHNMMHDRTTHRLTELGEQWRKRVSPHPLGKK